MDGWLSQTRLGTRSPDGDNDIGFDLLLVVFEGKPQVPKNWLRRNHCDLQLVGLGSLKSSDGIGDTKRMVKGTRWTLELFQDRQGRTIFDNLAGRKQREYLVQELLKCTKNESRSNENGSNDNGPGSNANQFWSTDNKCRSNDKGTGSNKNWSNDIISRSKLIAFKRFLVHGLGWGGLRAPDRNDSL